ncbi:MAG: hypothetical protein V1859_06405 [archaeon]
MKKFLLLLIGIVISSTLTQANCLDSPEWKSFSDKYCVDNNEFCKMVQNSPDLYCDKGYFTTSDLDADGIPDFYDRCKNTAPGDIIDNRKLEDGKPNIKIGCSYTQQLALVMAGIIYLEDITLTTIIDGKPLIVKGDDEIKKIIEKVPDKCTNGVQDITETGTDCGGTCKPCTGNCKKIISGGGLGVIMVPVGYSSSRFLSGNDFFGWEARAMEEAIKLSTTPPFAGRVTIYRIDAFEDNPIISGFLQILLTNPNFIPAGTLVSSASAYKSFCPDADLIYFLAEMPGRSYAYFKSKVAFVNSGIPNRNVITHETGHSLCGLSDEYIELGQSVGSSSSLNCDDTPFVYEQNYLGVWIVRPIIPGETCNGITKICLCKWHPLNPLHAAYTVLYASNGLIGGTFPNAGCIQGCNYNSFSYRPSFPFSDSMMNGNYLVGISSWNQVGFDVCNQMVSRFG